MNQEEIYKKMLKDIKENFINMSLDYSQLDLLNPEQRKNIEEYLLSFCKIGYYEYLDVIPYVKYANLEDLLQKASQKYNEDGIFTLNTNMYIRTKDPRYLQSMAEYAMNNSMGFVNLINLRTHPLMDDASKETVRQVVERILANRPNYQTVYEVEMGTYGMGK